MLLRAILPALSLAAFVCLTASTYADDVSVDLYRREIQPVLAQRCYSCHGALKQEGGLRVDTVELMKRGGDSGSSIATADPTNSLILQRITSTDPASRMPHEGESLKPEQIDAITRWVNSNAPGPADEVPEADPREHWAFKTVTRPTVPDDPSSWSRNAIDHFIAASHRKQGLKPQPSAAEMLLVRRLYVDLVGLPPSAQELAAIQFNEANWYEALVERLLQDSRYGERWARHWMDVWRYSDWWGLGDQLRNSQYHMWHWRDWIIESLNKDLPLDEMMRQMLAADELYPGDIDKLRATGYLARNYFLFNRNPWMEETVEHVSKSLLGLTMNCSKCHDHKFDPIEQNDFYRLRAFFEPYHVRLDMLPGEMDLNKNGLPRVYDGVLDAPTYFYNRGDENQPDKSKAISPDVPKILQFKPIEIQAIELLQVAQQPEYQPWIAKNYLAAAEEKLIKSEAAIEPIRQRAAQLRETIATTEAKLAGSVESESSPAIDNEKIEGELKSQRASLAEVDVELNAAQLSKDVAHAELESTQAKVALLETTRQSGESPVASNVDESRIAAVRVKRRVQLLRAQQAVVATELKLLRAKDDAKKGVEAELDKARQAVAQAQEQTAAVIAADQQPEALVGGKWTPTRFLNSTADDPAVKFPAQSTGRRRALASWITDSRNPLTARVAVNHLWNRHFGTPIVATTFDFGRKGALPTHPELLDWLASELVDSGWSMKHLHRLMVMSSTYRLSSSNLGGEDNLTKDTDNRLWWRRNPIRIESQVVRDSILQLSGELDSSLYGPSIPAAQQAESKRRSLYFFHSNNERNPFLSMFDEALVKECYSRDQSIVPQQALALVNSGLVLKSTEKIAQKITEDLGKSGEVEQEWVTRAFQLILGSSPTESELKVTGEALQRWQAIENHSPQKARQLLVWTLLNHNDFVTLR